MTPVSAQPPASPDTESAVMGRLAEMEKAAKNDIAAITKAAAWAKEQGLHTEWRRLLNRVLQLAPTNDAANQAIGNVKYDGRWMSPEKAEILTNRVAGLVAVAGVWVPEAEVEAARAGIFHFKGERVTKAEYLDLRAGKIRHPRTGELIAAADMEQAKNNLFPDGKGGWVDEAAANTLHSRLASPWVVRTKSMAVVSTMALEDIEQYAQQHVEDAYDFAIGLFGVSPQPTRRPVVMLVATSDQFRQVGDQIGGATSAYGGFLAENTISVPGLGNIRPAVALLDPNWGVYYLKHAVGVAVAHAIAANSLPAWWVSGTGSYVERFYSAEIANWFGKQFLAAGGLMDLAGWFRGFRIDGDMDNDAMGQRLFQAGLVLAFCRHGGDAALAKLLDAVGGALSQGDAEAVTSAVAAVEKGVEERGEALRAYLKTLTR